MNFTDQQSVRWQCVFKSNSLFEAQAVRGNLEAAAIPAIVLNKQDSSYLSFGYVEVHVPVDMVVAATQILQSPQNDND